MGVYRQGDIEIEFAPRESLATIGKIADEVERLQAQHWRLTRLQQIRHGHNFGADRRCGCGMTERDYFALGYMSVLACGSMERHGVE